MLREPETLLASHDPAPWLPTGGRAEVVLAPGAEVPHPTAVVRLMCTAAGSILAVPREDGRGLDLPTAPVGAAGPRSALAGLISRTLEAECAVELLGYVRNIVPPSHGYPWPVPTAHFTVWHCEATKGSELDGEWLGARHAAEELSGRHWWPLARQLASTGG